MLTDLFQETPIVISARPDASKESHVDEEGTKSVLAKLLGLDDVDASDRKQKPDAFSADSAKLSYGPKLQSDDNNKKTRQGKRRVRRQRCYPPFWQCAAPPSGSNHKQKSPRRGKMNS